MNETNSQLKYRIDFQNVPLDGTKFIIRYNWENKRGFIPRELSVQNSNYGDKLMKVVYMYTTPHGNFFDSFRFRGDTNDEINEALTKWLIKLAHSWCLKDD